MSLLDTASLIVTPNAYKEGKLYSVIPSDGSGDLSVTRATTATRVNSAGLVELTPYNLLTYSVLTGGSLNVTPTGWSQQNTTGNFEPFGNVGESISYRFWATTGRRYLVNSNTLVSGSSYAFSFYVDSVDTTTNLGSIYLPVQSGSTITNIQYYIDDVLVTSSTNITANTRIKVTFDCTSAGVVLHRFGGGVSNNATYDFVVSRPQFVEGTEAKDYFATQTRLNIPRLDYSNGTCPSILLEPQRTNLLQQSSSFDNVYWGKGNVSVSANTTTAPDGTLTADKIIENTSNSNHEINHSNVPLSASSYSYSVYAKADGRNWIALSIQSQYTFFDLQNGVVGSSAVGNVNDIKSVGNGWYRCTITRTAAAANNFGLIRLALDDNTPTYTGDGTSGIYLWGAQLEAGSYATSYIPTTTASVTRNAEVLSKTGISSLIGQTEGTIFLDYEKTNNDNAGLNGYFRIQLSDGSNTNSIYFGFESNQNVAAIVSSGVAQAVITKTGVQTQQRIKIALAYKENDFAFYYNGELVGVDTSGLVPLNLSQWHFGINRTTATNTSGIINSSLLWKTRLTNDQLAQLTTI